MNILPLLLSAGLLAAAPSCANFPKVLRGGGGGDRAEEGGQGREQGGRRDGGRQEPGSGAEPQPGREVHYPAPVPAETPDWMKTDQRGPEFAVDFAGPRKPIPSGLTASICDLGSTNAGAWEVWGEGLEPGAGLVRLWSKYHLSPVGKQTVTIGKQAQDAGLEVLMTFLGDPAQRDGNMVEAVEPPPDVEAWVAQIAKDFDFLRRQGVQVRYVEIWNEPDLKPTWTGTEQEFATFFATAGRLLRDRLPADVKIGGPSMGAGYGPGLVLLRMMLKECVRVGFRPDFISWHDYPGYPTDQGLAQQAMRVREAIDAAGVGEPELILSEWNQGVPFHGRAWPEVDDHRGAAYYVAMVSALTESEVEHAIHFFLMDARWGTKVDYEGRSLGMITINGAPKAVLGGMRLARQAFAKPAVPVERGVAPANLSLVATRDGQGGYLLAANSFGSIDLSARKHLEGLGVDLRPFASKQDQVRRYLSGKISLEQLGPAADQREGWQAVRNHYESFQREARAARRSVRVRMNAAPERIGRVWLIDATHGNPMADEDFQRRFRKRRDALQQDAFEATMATLEREGATAAERQGLRAAFAARDLESADGVSAALRKKAQQTFVRTLAELQSALVVELAQDPDIAPALVDAAGYADLDGAELVLQLPPHTVMLVECLWKGGNGR